MRDWQDERWVKLYTRDEPEWLVLPWKARGLFDEILKRLDPAGVMRLGKAGRKAIAAALSASWDAELADMINILEEDGAIHFLEGETLLQVPNFVEAQESKQSDRARQQKRRARARAFEDTPVTQRDIPSRDPNQGGDDQCGDTTFYDTSTQSSIDTRRDSSVTERDNTVTQRDQTVTRCHALSRREEKRREEREEIPPIVPQGGTVELALDAEYQSSKVSKVDEVFDYWREQHMPKAKKTEDRTRRIKARLKEGYTVNELCLAIDGVFHDDFLMGANDREKEFRDIVTIFKSGAKVDDLIKLAEQAEEASHPVAFDYPKDPPGTKYCGPPPGFFDAVEGLGKL